MKVDFFSDRKLEVLDVNFGVDHTLVLCFDSDHNRNRLFGCGTTRRGQLGFIQKEPVYEFREVKMPNDEEVVNMATGAFHSLFLTKSNKLFGCGCNNNYQLGDIEQSVLNSKISTKFIVEVKLGNLNE
mgnify:CR=1 FL=1